jgi:hypothetical protein
VASLSRSSDIVVIGASRERARSMLESPAPLAEEALRCKLSVLFLPNRVVRRTGPIVVLASDPEEASLGAGLSLAMALKSELIVVATGEAPPSGWEIAGAGGTAGAGIRLIHAPLLSQMLVARLAVLEHLHEGLLVLPGGGQEHSFAASLAAERRVPVLIVQGDGAAE